MTKSLVCFIPVKIWNNTVEFSGVFLIYIEVTKTCINCFYFYLGAEIKARLLLQDYIWCLFKSMEKQFQCCH